MDKAIDKGNLIDFFAVLLPGMVIVILGVATNLPNSFFINDADNKISIGKDVMSSIAVLLIFTISSYLAGLLLMEVSVILQKIFPSFFDYYRVAIKKDALKDEGADLFEFMVFRVPYSCSETNPPLHLAPIQKKIEQRIEDYDKKESWLMTHGYGDTIERKKAYSMMNRSMATLPIVYIIIQAFIAEFSNKGRWPNCWVIFLIIIVGVILYYRARRQALVFYHEVNSIYECALDKYLEKDKQL